MGVDCFVYLPRMSMRFDLNARGNYMGYQSGEEAVCDGRDRSRPGGEAAGLNESEREAICRLHPEEAAGQLYRV